MDKAITLRIESGQEMVSFLRSDGVKQCGLTGIWVKDEDALHSLDPQIVEWIVEGLVSVLPALISWLAGQAKKHKSKITIAIPTESGISITITEEMSKKEQVAVVKKLTNAVETPTKLG